MLKASRKKLRLSQVYNLSIYRTLVLVLLQVDLIFVLVYFGANATQRFDGLYNMYNICLSQNLYNSQSLDFFFCIRYKKSRVR